MKNYVLQAKEAWAALPHQVQAAIVVFAAAAGAALGKSFSDPVSCWQWVCMKHYIGGAIGAGAVALRVFYMCPNKQPSICASAEAKTAS